MTSTDTPTPTATATATPSPTDTADPGAGSVGGVADDASFIEPGSTLELGQHLLVVAEGFQPDEEVAAELHSTVRGLGTVHADSDGVAVLGFTVPKDLEPGNHGVVLTSTSHSETFPFVINTSSDVTPTPTPTPVDTVEAAPVTTATSTGATLPFTGSNIQFVAALAVLLLLCGAVLVCAARLIDHRPHEKH